MSSTRGPFIDRATAGLLGQLTTAVVLVGGDHRPAYLNPAAERLLAPTDKSPSLLPETLGALADRARTEDRPITARDLILHGTGEGSTRHVDATLTPLDEPAGWLLIEFRAHDDARETAEALLSQHGAANMLVRSLGHELRNPLAGLRGATQLLKRELGDSALAEYVDLIERETHRMASLLDRLGMPVPERAREPVNIHGVLQQVASLVEGESEHQLQVVRDYDPSLPVLEGSHDALVQALVNLARNAWQAGAGRLRLRTRLERDGLVASSRHPRVLRVDVQDDGPGVPAHIRPLVFFPMVTGRRDGTGLGLALAQSVAIRHDGLITFESEPGNTVFTLRLPLNDTRHDR
jgi:two-component system nitrogen regulation sensor histidine kinase GlnL